MSEPIRVVKTTHKKDKPKDKDLAFGNVFTDHMGEWLLDIWRRSGKTVVFVTHGLHEALALSTRVIVMTARPGRVKSVLELPMPYPRAMDGLEMVALRAKLWGEIRDESLRAMGER